ncbi:MAG: calcium-binding protein, partial [Gemmobacter sp.]
MLINGIPLPEDSETLLGTLFTPAGAHVLLAFFDPGTNTDYVFQIGGAPLTLPTTVAEFNVLEASILGAGAATGAFAPGQNNPLANILNVQIEEGPGRNTITGTNGDDDRIGTPGDDLIITGNATPNGDYVAGSAGNDTIDMRGNDGVNGFVLIDYFNQPSISVSINGVANTGSVAKGTNGTDTLLGVANPLDAGNFEGGLEIRGTAGNDTFNLTLDSGQWISVLGGAGQDSYTLNGDGMVRLDFRSAPGGININLATRQILNDGFGNFETIGGTAKVHEVQGTLANDIFVGSNDNDRYRFLGGNNTIDGGAGFDRVRYDHVSVGSVNVNLASGTANITMRNGNTFTDSLANIEDLRGSGGNDTLRGDAAANRLDGRGGDDVLISGGGNDTLIGGGGADRFVLTGTGNVAIADFQIGTDVLDLRQLPLDAAAVAAAFANATEGGGGTTVSLGVAGSLFLNGLSKAQAVQIAPLTPLPATPVLMELFGDDDFIGFAFFNTAENQVRLDVISWTTTQIVLRNPSNGAVTTITGTGFPAAEQDTPPGTVTGWETRDAGGTLVTRLSATNWPLAEMF